MDRRASEAYRIPSICLMENAGAGAARVVREVLGRAPGHGSGHAADDDVSGPVVCVCGPGNNGGDGLVVARHLALAGVPVRVVLLTSRSGAPARGDAGTQLAIVEALELPLRHVGPDTDAAEIASLFGGATLLVDGVFGTGLDAAPRGASARVIEALNASPCPVVALDLPSGLDCDTGTPLGPCVRADITVTFVAPKIGFDADGAGAWTGAVRVVGIGAPLAWPLA